MAGTDGVLAAALAAHNGNMASLARALDLSPSSVGRWFAGVTKPDYGSCLALAAITSMPPRDVLQAAGHDPQLLDVVAPSGASVGEMDPIEHYIRQGTAQMHDVLDGTPRPFWSIIIKSTFDRAIDGARDMARLVTEDQSAARSVRSPADAAHRRRGGRPNRHADGGPTEITAHYLSPSLVLATP